jgi:hypothetical protein
LVWLTFPPPELDAVAAATTAAAKGATAADAATGHPVPVHLVSSSTTTDQISSKATAALLERPL